MKRRCTFLLALLAAVVLNMAVLAQSEIKPKIGGDGGPPTTKEERKEAKTTRSALGIVTGPDDQPVVGAVVQVKNLHTLQVRSFITQGDGTYHFSGLKNDDDYELLAKSGDMTAPTRKLSIFDNRKEAVFNFKLEKK